MAKNVRHEQQQPQRPATSTEVREQLAHYESEIVNLNVQLDSEESVQSSSLDDATAFRLSIERCVHLAGEVERFEKLVLRTQGELAGALRREAEDQRKIRLIEIQAWASAGTEVYTALDRAVADVEKAIAGIVDHIGRGRELNLAVASDPHVIVPAALKTSPSLQRFAPLVSWVPAHIAAPSAGAFYDLESPPGPPEPAPRVVFAIHDSPPSPWESHVAANKAEQAERELSQQNLPSWVDKLQRREL